eukprot:721600-Hanusia_phi.AAC.1
MRGGNEGRKVGGGERGGWKEMREEIKKETNRREGMVRGDGALLPSGMWLLSEASAYVPSRVTTPHARDCRPPGGQENILTPSTTCIPLKEQTFPISSRTWRHLSSCLPASSSLLLYMLSCIVLAPERTTGGVGGVRASIRRAGGCEVQMDESGGKGGGREGGREEEGRGKEA